MTQSAVDPVAALALSALHADLSDAERAALAGQIIVRDYAGGSPVFDQNDPGDGAYVVVDGRVRIAKRLPGGKTITVADHTKGALFGELALAGRGGLRTANAVAMEQTQLLFLPLDAFQASLRQPGPVAVKLLAKLETLINARLSATLAGIPQSGARPSATATLQVGADFPVRDFLAKLPCCADLGKAGGDWLLAEGEVISASKGTSFDDAVYLLIRGAARATQGDQQLEIRGPGRFCAAPNLADLGFTASEDSTALRFELERFTALIRGDEAPNLSLAQAFIADKVQTLAAVNAYRARVAALAVL